MEVVKIVITISIDEFISSSKNSHLYGIENLSKIGNIIYIRRCIANLQSPRKALVNTKENTGPTSGLQIMTRKLNISNKI